MLTFEDLHQANLARQAEWNPHDVLSLEYMGCALAGEAGEACNVIKKISRERHRLLGTTSSPEKLLEELADTVIYAEIIATMVGRDLGNAVRRKFNATSKQLGFKTMIEGSD